LLKIKIICTLGQKLIQICLLHRESQHVGIAIAKTNSPKAIAKTNSPVHMRKTYVLIKFHIKINLSSCQYNIYNCIIPKTI